MKALRNARARLIAEEIKIKIITLAKELKKTHKVTQEDDISPSGENGQHDEADMFNAVQVLIEDVAAKTGKTVAHFTEYFTAKTKKQGNEWVRVEKGVDDLRDYKGDMNKLYEKIKKYYEKVVTN